MQVKAPMLRGKEAFAHRAVSAGGLRSHNFTPGPSIFDINIRALVRFLERGVHGAYWALTILVLPVVFSLNSSSPSLALSFIFV